MNFSLTKVPEIITPEIARRCKKIVGHDNAYFVDVIYRPNSFRNKCAYNAREEASRINGEIVFGWSLFIWELVLIQFIGHAIVGSKDCRYCVTPAKYGEKRILFIPDDTITFDFQNENSRLPSKTLPISKHKLVRRLIDVKQKLYELKVKYPVTRGTPEISDPDAVKTNALEKEQGDLLNRVIYAHHPVKDKCICGSGKQFRKCCRPQMKKIYG